MAAWKFTSTLKTITSTQAFKSITPKWLCIFGWNFVWSIGRTLMLIDIKTKKNNNRIKSQWPLKIYVNPSKIYVNPAFKSIQMTYSL